MILTKLSRSDIVLFSGGDERTSKINFRSFSLIVSKANFASVSQLELSYIFSLSIIEYFTKIIIPNFHS